MQVSDLQLTIKVVFMSCLGFYVIKYCQTMGCGSKGFISLIDLHSDYWVAELKEYVQYLASTRAFPPVISLKGANWWISSTSACVITASLRVYLIL